MGGDSLNYLGTERIIIILDSKITVKTNSRSAPFSNSFHALIMFVYLQATGDVVPLVYVPVEDDAVHHLA